MKLFVGGDNDIATAALRASELRRVLIIGYGAMISPMDIFSFDGNDRYDVSYRIYCFPKYVYGGSATLCSNICRVNHGLRRQTGGYVTTAYPLKNS